MSPQIRMTVPETLMIDQLQQRFNQPGVRFFLRDRLVMLEMRNQHGSTVVTTQGATVLSYVPTDGREVIWVSDSARYDGSKAVRGGIPVCWPWFGPHPDDPALPAHGFARQAIWRPVAVTTEAGVTCATFRLEPDERTRSIWPQAFRLELTVRLGECLEVELRSTNPGPESIEISEALHSYFRVECAHGIAVEGLDGLAYWDKQQGGVRGVQDRPLRVEPPIDRVFFRHTEPALIHDRERDIHVEKRGSATTVVWNPGPEGVRSFDDIPDPAWTEMLCVETANALDDQYTLAPGETHVLGTRISTFPTEK